MPTFYSSLILRSVVYSLVAQLVRRYTDNVEVGSSNLPETTKWGITQLARAPALHAGGRRFDSDILHKREKLAFFYNFCSIELKSEELCYLVNKMRIIVLLLLIVSCYMIMNRHILDVLTSSINYDSSAFSDDLSCLYDFGCTDVNACNYNPLAITDDESCDYVDNLFLNLMTKMISNKSLITM